MPRYKSIICGSRIVIAGKARKCYHNKRHRVLKGQLLLEVRDGLGWKGYCPECARAMIDAARDTLRELESGLDR